MNILHSLIGKTSPDQITEMDLDYLNFLHIHYYVSDRNGKYVSYNDRMAKTLGCENVNDFLGLTIFDFPFVGFKEKEMVSINNDKIMRNKKSYSFIEPATLYDGSKIIAYSHKSPLRSLSNKIIGTVGFSLIVKMEDASFPLINDLDNYTETDAPLSKRQIECLYYLVKGMTIKKIADELNLSFRTVGHYIENVRNKLKCDTREELIDKALQLSVIRGRI